ncbi:MAG: ABC transporter substrate-binding protein [Alphaproteobacteria bacterium]|nr:ABC transporter substrate-binding protein [Alphaproteobacteria bacterium]
MAGPAAAEYVETPMLKADVAEGKLPAVAERLPATPLLVRFGGGAKVQGRHGGELKTLIGRAKDIRLLVVYGYARLVGYNERFEIEPDLVESVRVEEGRIFTFKLREGHKWSDGQPFTADDFRYYWEDVANNEKLSPAGPPKTLLVNGKPATFEVLDPLTVRYSWTAPNPFFLPRLAGASPLFIYRPAHYLKRFHEKYADPEKLAAALKAARKRNWASLHNRVDNMYRFDNPALPTLQPWVNTTRPPATRFRAVRNPYFHRVDAAGHQLPYIDKIVMQVSDSKLIPAKAGTGEVDLQARSIFFNNYTFLRENEAQHDFKTHLWRIAKGSHMALFPNLNANDEVWRKLMRDVRFRRALSLAVDRAAINETMFFGLALEGNNTVLPDSPLYRESYQKAWTEYDPDQAAELLDEIGLTERNDDDIRLLPDGRPLEIIVETAGEDSEQTDILQLVQENWQEVGIKLFIKPSQREVFRNRIFAGETSMSVWSGLENGVPSPDTNPGELAPTSQQQLQWPKWGQHYESNGVAGEKPDLAGAVELAALNQAWLVASERGERESIWRKMLEINAEQVFSIGLIAGVKQPIVVKNGLRNVPETGIYNWDPGAQFGIYRPDVFWLEAKN